MNDEVKMQSVAVQNFFLTLKVGNKNRNCGIIRTRW